MGPGFKYHVVTVAAIFFALTVGLVIGTLYVSPLALERQNKSLKRLETVARTENQTLRQEADWQQRFDREAVPALLAGKLAGVKIALVQTGDYADLTETLRDTLQTADARILSVTTLERALTRPDSLFATQQEKRRQSEPRLPATRADLLEALANTLAHGDSLLAPLIPMLESTEMLRRDSASDYSGGVDYVILVAGSRAENADRAADIDAPLIQALQKQGVTVLACETRNAEISDVRTYKTLAITTVDNADTDYGRCALVYALRGDKDSYGVKDSANRFLPSLQAKPPTP